MTHFNFTRGFCRKRKHRIFQNYSILNVKIKYNYQTNPCLPFVRYRMLKRRNGIPSDRSAKLILISLYYRGRNAAACHCHVTLSRALVRSSLSLLHPPVHPAARAKRVPMCPIPSAIRVTATFIRGTTDRSAGAGSVHVRYVHTGYHRCRGRRRHLNHR